MNAVTENASVLEVSTLIPDFENRKHSEFLVDARRLYEFLEGRQKFSNWIKSYILKFQFIENKDFKVCVTNLLSKECVVQGRGGHNSVDYLLTLGMAKELAMLQRSAKGRQARQYFIECERKLLERRHVLPQTYAEALRELADKTEQSEKLQMELQTSEAERKQAVSKAVHAGRIVAAEDVSIPLSVWLARTSATHGHGPIVGLKVLRALGVLHRELVKGCRNTKETAISQRLIEMGVLFYSSRDFLKKKWFNNPQAEVVVDSTGKALTGTSRVVMISPEGTDKMMKWFLNRPETALRRLVMNGSGVINRLAGRYSFMEHDNNAWDELTQSERNSGVRIVKLDEGKAWRVWCDNNKSMVTGEGSTLEMALLNLAENYNGKDSNNQQ
jgi:anti-repressor protein